MMASLLPAMSVLPAVDRYNVLTDLFALVG
jgi:hypothetical protein